MKTLLADHASIAAHGDWHWLDSSQVIPRSYMSVVVGCPSCPRASYTLAYTSRIRAVDWTQVPPWTPYNLAWRLEHAHLLQRISTGVDAFALDNFVFLCASTAWLQQCKITWTSVSRNGASWLP